MGHAYRAPDDSQAPAPVPCRDLHRYARCCGDPECRGRGRHSHGVVHPRPQHVAWDGLVLPTDDPFWSSHYPPNGWGCKCRAFAVNDGDIGRLGKDGPDHAPVAADDTTGIDQGWDYAPGANAKTPLRELIERKLFGLPAPIGAAMWQALEGAVDLERDLAWKDTLDAWLVDDYPRGHTAVVGALKPEVLAWLAKKGKPVPPTAEIAIRDNLPRGHKQLRHEADQNGLTLDEWRALPALLRVGDTYFHRDTGHLVFVADGSGPTKAAVAFDPKKTRASGALSVVVSGFRVSAEDVAGMVKGGLWQIVR
ncbi:MAG: phage minor head protein [Chromatiaceae bacterium]